MQAEKGRVTLNGSVASWLENQLVSREAYELSARNVNNHLQVRPFAQPLTALSPTSQRQCISLHRPPQLLNHLYHE